jgi:hypothetical protein
MNRYPVIGTVGRLLFRKEKSVTELKQLNNNKIKKY